MIRKYCFRLDRQCPAHTSYALYAAALDRAVGDFAALAHEDKSTPVAQYVHGDRWHISLLTDTACEALGPVLDNMEPVRLDWNGQWLTLAPPTVACFDPQDCRRFRFGQMQFHTPTAFRANNAYQILPIQQLMLQSLIGKWNMAFGEKLPSELAQELAALLIYRKAEVKSDVYHMKKQQIPGFTGTLDVQIRDVGELGLLLSKLLTFGSFSGVGIKTALGMGGMTIHAQTKSRGANEQNCR
jgi:CRISPR-associated endoribonuclease Cas6